MPELKELDLTAPLVEMIRRAATILPQEMVETIRTAKDTEEEGSAAEGALLTILDNIELAREFSTPICQDTGTPIFEVSYPVGVSIRRLQAQIEAACVEATAKAYLRPNAVDPLTGKNSGNNTGEDYPTIHFHEWDEDGIHIDLMLKGGGCENVSTQYKLPDTRLHAGRDLDGVRKVVLDAVYQAQGKGCAPGVLGVAVGGDRGSSYIKAKQQLLRPLSDTNPNPELAELESTLYEQSNQLGIGPMGFGGKTTVLGVKIGTQHRLPASFYVSIAYMCWANRRATLNVSADGEVTYEL